MGAILAKNRFYQVSVRIESEPDAKGRTKKSREVYLVDAADVIDAEKKISTEMEFTVGDWEITSISLARVIGVIS
jgi:hypothetical protein